MSNYKGNTLLERFTLLVLRVMDLLAAQRLKGTSTQAHWTAIYLFFLLEDRHDSCLQHPTSLMTSVNLLPALLP